MKTPTFICFALALAFLLICGGARAQGKITLGNDSLHLIYDNNSTPVPQAGGWSALTMQLWGGTSALTMSLQTTIVGDAIGNSGLPDGRIQNRNITLAGVPGGATAFLQLRFFRPDSPQIYSPVFTMTTGSSIAFNSIVNHGAPSFSTWEDAPLYLGCLECAPPYFVVNPASASVSLASNVTLSADARSYQAFPPVRYQWRKENLLIVVATNSFLTLSNVTWSHAGNYDVVASDDYGSTTSTVATITVLVPALAATLGPPSYTANNQFQFTVTGATGSNYIVQASTNLATGNWLSLLTNPAPFTFVETNVPSFTKRFYRAWYSP